MADKPWKALERKVAEALKGKRVLGLGSKSPDVDCPIFAPECKYRSGSRPPMYESWLNQAASYNTGKIPIVVVKRGGKRGEIVMLAFDDFVDLVYPPDES